jgi:predicted lipoprotein with Yx(FWY)xxD motif
LGDHVRKDKKGTAAACMGEKANSYRNLMGKSTEKGNRDRTIRTREDSIKMDLKQKNTLGLVFMFEFPCIISL